MKLYYSPGACSLASHITLHEVGRPFEIERADIAAKTTESGADYRKINPKGAVPALQLDNGEVLTEGAAIMQYVADVAGANELLPPSGTVGRARVQEMLNYIGSELHKSYSPFFNPALTDEARTAQRAIIDGKLGWIEETLADGRVWLTGDAFTPADAYLFTVTNWSAHVGHDLARFPRLVALRARIAARPAVVAALAAEGLAA